MADRPIIFSGPMVRALLAGTKTQTRRLVPVERYAESLRGHASTGLLHEFQPGRHGLEFVHAERGLWHPEMNPNGLSAWYVPVGWRVGDRLWVRENCSAVEQPSGEDGVLYLADDAWHPIQVGSRGASDDWLTLYRYGSTPDRPCRGRKVPSIHMPRWASRLTLEVTEVKVERLGDISEADAVAEGVTIRMEAGLLPSRPHEAFPVEDHRGAFQRLWSDMHGPASWAANPWVAAISFTVTPANIDTLPERP